MKIHFAQPSFSEFHDWEINALSNIRAEFQSSSCIHYHELAESADTADLIIFIESLTFKSRSHIHNLCKEPLLQKHANKLLTYCFQDGSCGFLDGIYVCTEKKTFIQGSHKSWPAVWPYNELIDSVTDAEIEQAPAPHLCSFKGNLSSPLRRQIADYYQAKANSRLVINLTGQWYNHLKEEKRSYIDEILQSRFVLCPKGICSYTHRFFETLALGRVPVLLADDWIPPENLDMDSVAIRVRERDFADLEEIIRSKEGDAIEMGLNGRRYWKSYFSKEVRLKALIDVALSCLEQREQTPTLEDYVKRWSSFSFSWANGWTPMQRAGKRIQKMTQFNL